VAASQRGRALTLGLLAQRLAVCRLEAGEDLPAWALAGDFFSITRTGGELSIVCPEEAVPPGARAQIGFRALGVAGPLDFALTGILTSLLDPLAEAAIPVFAISTYDTDYVLVRERDLDRAVAALGGAGHRVSGRG
jgi:hypothetical protein